ncbi:putative Neuralized, partial [Operophtera brumata]
MSYGINTFQLVHSAFEIFNNGFVMTNRTLKTNELFQVRLDLVIPKWAGSIEIGVTQYSSNDITFPSGTWGITGEDVIRDGAIIIPQYGPAAFNIPEHVFGIVGALAGTATDLSWDTYILSGSAMMKDGECVRSGYPLDLDTLTVGSRVEYGKQSNLSEANELNIAQLHVRSFSEYHGDNVTLSKDYSTARRLTPDPMGALVFSSSHLIVNELYEIQILECKHSYAGSFRMGVTDVNVLNANINRHLPLCASWLPHFTAYIDGKYLKYSRPDQSGEKDLHSFVPSFEWLRPGDRIGLKKTPDSKKVYVLMELYGTTTKIQTVSRGTNVVPGNQQTTDIIIDVTDKPSTAPEMVESDETCEVPAVEEPDETLPTPPQSELPDETSPQETPDPGAVPEGQDAQCAVPPGGGEPPEDVEASTSGTPRVVE